MQVTKGEHGMLDYDRDSWKISIDPERTRDYYKNHSRDETQFSKNFKSYIGSLTSEEKSFFDSMGVDIFSCEVDIRHARIKKTDIYNCEGEIIVCAADNSCSNDSSVALTDLLKNYKPGFSDVVFEIGRFTIHFLGARGSYSFIPDGFVCYKFYCNDIQWMLDEPIVKIDYGTIELQRYNEAFSTLGIKATAIDPDSIEEYKKEWVDAFARPSRNITKIRNVCAMYIWHLFSFGFRDCYEEDEADKKYDMQEKGECVFLSNIRNIAFIIEDATPLTSKLLSQFIDITITPKDFSWTYCKTHEGDFGPYFYKKDNN